MTSPEPYYSVDLLRDSLRANSAVFNEDDYILAVQAASDWIDARCSDHERGLVRHFWRSTELVTDEFHATDHRVVDVGDFDIADGEDPPTVEVRTEDGGWAAVPDDAWSPEPTRRPRGYPYTRLVWLSYSGGWPLGIETGVRFTRRPGWLAVPKAVPMACRIIAGAGMLGTDVIANEELYISSTNPGNPFTLAEGMLRPYMLAQADVDAESLGAR